MAKAQALSFVDMPMHSHSLRPPSMQRTNSSGTRAFPLAASSHIPWTPGLDSVDTTALEPERPSRRDGDSFGRPRGKTSRRRLQVLLAIALLVPALALARGSDDAADLHVRQRLFRRDDGAVAQTAQAIAQARRAGDERGELSALRAHLAVLGIENPPASELAIVDRGLALSRKLGDEAAFGRLLFFQANCFMGWRNSDLAPGLAGMDAALVRSIEIARRKGLERLLADDYLLRAMAEMTAVQGARALADLKRAFALYRSLGQNYLLAVTMVDIVQTYRTSIGGSVQDLETAAGLLDRAAALFDPVVDKQDIADLLIEQGLTQRQLQHVAAAEQAWRRAIAMAEELQRPDTAADARFRLGESLLDRGLPGEALPLLAASLPQMSRAGPRVRHPSVLIAMARAQARLRQRNAALESLAAAAVLVKDLRVAWLDVNYRAAAAEILALFGDDARANDELRQLGVSEREAARVNDEQRLRELKVAFEADMKDRDNALLAAHAARDESRRLALTLALVLSVFGLGGGAALLNLRLRSQCASNAMLARLAHNGREITCGLDEQAVLRTLRRQLRDMARATSIVLWLRGATGLERARAGLAEIDDDDATLPDAAALAARCASSGRTLVERGARSSGEPRVRPGARRRAAEPLRVFEPLVVVDQVIGVVGMEVADARRFGYRERQIVRTTCLYAAGAIANIRTAQLLGESKVELEQERTRDMLAHTAGLVTVGSMASGIVHEMSHPVGAMMLQSSNAQAMLAADETSGASEALGAIHREARRLQGLIARLRNLCRAEPPCIGEIDLSAVLEDARVLFLPQLQLARVELVQEATNVRVSVDAERAVLAIANIVFNAVDAMEDQPRKRVDIRVTTCDGFARVHVRDVGPGLTATQFAHLFEPFYTTKPPGKGLGLGLALSVKSVMSMGGRIEAANHPEGGAVFTVCLPHVRAHEGLPSVEAQGLHPAP